MQGLRRSVVTGLRWQAAAKVGSQLITWPITIIVMRLLAPEDYGLMAMTMVLVGLTTLVAEMGLGTAIVRATEPSRDLLRSVFGLALMVNLGLYGALLVLAPLSVSVFNEPRLWALTAAVGLQLPFAALAIVPESMARRELKFKTLSIIELSTQVVTAFATLLSAWSGLGVWSLVVGHVLASAFRTTLLMVQFEVVSPRLTLRGQRDLVAFGSSLTANRIVWYGWSQADIFIAGKILGQQALGVYAVAVNLANMPMQKLMAVSNQVTFSALAKLRHDTVAMGAALIQAMTLMLAIAVGLLWGMAGTAAELVPVLLGERWQGAIVPLQIIAAVVPLRVASGMISSALVVCGHVNDDLVNTIVAAVLLVPSFWIGATWGGLHGLAWAWAWAYPCFVIWLVVRSCGRLGVQRMAVLTCFRSPMLAGLCMLAAIQALRAWSGITALPWLLAAEIVVGALVYTAILWLIDRKLIDAALEFAGRRQTT